jgi:hypothetical protein
MIQWLQGKKTYITAVVAGGLAAAQVIWPGFAVPEWAWLALAALGLGFIRAGIAKSNQ